jgi:hypothetical protein
MNEWFVQTLAFWQEQITPWMPWADDALQAGSAWIEKMPAVVWIGAALWLAMGVADRVQRWGGLRSSAYWGCGALLAAGCLLFWPASSLMDMAERSEWLLDMALGWILFTVGQKMDMRWLLRNKALAATAVLEFAVTAFTVSALLIMLGLAWPAACVAGIVAADQRAWLAFGGHQHAASGALLAAGFGARPSLAARRGAKHGHCALACAAALAAQRLGFGAALAAAFAEPCCGCSAGALARQTQSTFAKPCCDHALAIGR